MKRLLMLVLMGLLIWAWYEREALGDFPGILSAFTAKEYCSCRFVTGFDEAYCRRYVEQWLPLSRLEEHGAARQVIAEGLGRRAVAAWQGAREGCRLLP